MDSLPHLHLPSMMSSKLVQEWQAPAETTIARLLKKLKISPIIDYVVKPSNAKSGFCETMIYFVTTTYYLFCNCDFFFTNPISLCGLLLS